MTPSQELFSENNNEKPKIKLHDYLNINVIKLTTVIILDYRYGKNSSTCEQYLKVSHFHT